MNRFAPVLFLVGLALAFTSSASALPTGSTFLISRPDGTGPVVPPTDNDSFGPLAVSAEGRYVAFVSTADGFAAGANPRVANVFVRDTVAGTTVLASRSDGANGAGANADVDQFESPRIGIVVMPSGRMQDAPLNQPHVLVVFATRATNLVDHADGAIPPTGGHLEVWMRDVTAGTTYLVSRATGLKGAAADGDSRQPSVAAGPHGPLVAFASRATNLGRFGVEPPFAKVFLREAGEAVTHLVSCPFKSCGGGLAQGDSREPSLQYMTGPAGYETCAVGRQCALVAFTTADPTVGGAATRSQVILGRAFEKADGSGLAEFDRWETQSTVMLEPTRLGDGNSFSPSLLPDGSIVGFLSQATNLTPPPVAPPLPPGVTQAFFHIPPDGTLLASQSFVNNTVVAANSPIRTISLGGTQAGGYRFGFESSLSNFGFPLTSLDPSNLRAYQYMRGAGYPSPVDLASGTGAIGDRRSLEPVVSADASTVAFLSLSDNLNAGGGIDFARVYSRRVDPKAPDYGSLRLVSRPSGTAPSPGSKRADLSNTAVSADGRFVAFESNADDLSSADDNRFVNIFVRDTVQGATTLVSRASGANGLAADADSHLGGISDNGRRVLFTTRSGTFGATRGPERSFVRDLDTQTTIFVSRGNGPTGTVVAGEGEDISGDGNRVVFWTGSVLHPDAANGVVHLYVRDLAAQTTTFVDRGNGENGDPAKATPEIASLDRDGNRVAWTTEAQLTGTGATGTERKVYVRDLDASTTVLASRADGANGAEANSDSFYPAIDAAGNTVAFESDATNLGQVASRSIWVRQLNTGHTELVSRASGASGAISNQPSFRPSIDAAGDRVAFVTQANFGALPPSEAEPPRWLAYIRDLGTKATILASRVNGTAGAPADPGGFGRVSLSDNGNCVAFASSGLNYTDVLASADFPAVRERVLRGECGPQSMPSGG